MRMADSDYYTDLEAEQFNLKISIENIAHGHFKGFTANK